MEDAGAWAGHVLCSDENTAAQQALAYAVETLNCVGRRGAPHANLFTLLTLLKEDLEFRHFNFSNFEEFNSLIEGYCTSHVTVDVGKAYFEHSLLF